MPFSDLSRESGNGGIAPTPANGTPVATYTSFKSARPFDAKPGFSGWGGARNRADRVSDNLSQSQASGIIEAAQFAAAIGLPFNCHVIIHWERAGVPHNQAAQATARFLKLASDWIAKSGAAVNKQTRDNGPRILSFAWVWARENDVSGYHSKGSHVHILLHLPLALNWSGWRVRRWVSRLTGKPYRAGVLRTTRIGGKVCAAFDTTAAYHANLSAVAGYLLKGTTVEAAKTLGLERLETGGRILGKRVATSQNIGKSARQRHSVCAKS